MKADITLKITPKMAADAQGNERVALAGHLGTHFDVMNQEFPLEYTERPGVIFDVRNIFGRDIVPEDIDVSKIKKGAFTAFCTGYSSREPYGSHAYFSGHPQLSLDLIRLLVEKEVSIIGVDCAGVRRGKEHTPTDQYCADHGVFVVENLWGLEQLLDSENWIIHTYPMNYAGVTGLPCRVIAELSQARGTQCTA